MKPVAVIGAGPAGLAAALELVRRGARPVVLEKSRNVGGLARTEKYKDYYYDIGGHRFFTGSDEINRLWREMLGDDLLKVKRMSRILYQGRFFNYPLEPLNVLSNLGLKKGLRILLSYLGAHLRPHKDEETFDRWAENRFGRYLYEMFFRGYTEKVWGIPASEIRAAWAAERIKGLSLMSAVMNALFKTQSAKTMIGEFYYPRMGPGMMWQAFKDAVERRGGEVHLGREAVEFRHDGKRVTTIVAGDGTTSQDMKAGEVISSMPVSLLVSRLEPKPPEEVLDAARGLRYRAFILVGLIVEKENVFPDQWLYIHSPEAVAGRVQNFKRWSPDMVPRPGVTSLGMEYFADEGDELWSMPDEGLLELASTELARLGLAGKDAVSDGFVVRQPKAYPVYDNLYLGRLEVIRGFLGTLKNLQTVGRNGLHRYNNMDHSMLTGMLAARNLTGESHNLWEVRED